MRKFLKKIFAWTAPLFYRMPLLFHYYHRSLGQAAARKYNFPGQKLIVIGVTGTNGKTTTCNLIYAILKAAGKKAGLISTVNVIINDKETVNDTKLTSLPPETTEKLLAEMVGAGSQYAVLEVSSIALDQDRFFGVPFDVAVFTNLTHDHLDYHQTMANYLKAKSKLFRDLSSSRKTAPKISVVNADDESSETLLKFPADKKIRFGLEASPKEITAKRLDESEGRYLFDFNGQTIAIQLKLKGLFNLYNALAAASAAYGLGLPLSAIRQGLESVSLVPGRMQEVKAGQAFRVFVDYAHTPDGFEKILGTLKKMTAGRLITVFGAAGERDSLKRPILGQVASSWSDIIVLTEEDPGREDPLNIIAQIRAGLAKNFIENQNLFIVPERREAIKKAFSLAEANDTVAILGMGAQTVMATKTGKISYHEPSVARELLQSKVE
jgi:UDP-N-acetylmuramoyl-L-alanyl-D-glutamate--2,6-diaminopimelate ligase